MAEKLVLRPILDGVELEDIDMREPHHDTIYGEEMVFYTSGHVIVDSKAPYHYNIRITRKPTEEEMKGD